MPFGILYFYRIFVKANYVHFSQLSKKFCIPYQYVYIYKFSDLTFTACSGSVCRVLDVGQRVARSELTREICCAETRHFILCVVLVQSRKTGNLSANMTE